MNNAHPANSILNQLSDMLSQLDDKTYNEPLLILSGNTIGKHIRHIIEFFDCLIKEYDSGIINYDNRERNPAIENFKETAISEISRISEILKTLCDKSLLLITNFEGAASQNNTTSFNRELTYNIEHAVHHMAIIRIALNQEKIEVEIPDNFGVAYSTIKYEEVKCAQ